MISEPAKSQRRRPRQARARATCDAILEAAAQILERDGPAGFNTNAIAERAGVSIGTLYQYFPDKVAILMAAAAREAARNETGFARRSKALLLALVAFLDSLGPRTAAAAPPCSKATKARRGRGPMVIRLVWTPPAVWLQPLLTPAILRARPRRR